MHWLAIIFLVLKALDDVVGNLGNLIDGEYNSVFGKVFGTLLNGYAWYYVLTYVFSGVQ